jgi:hypothetical protein
MSDQPYQPYPPAPPCSISVDVPTTKDADKNQAAAQEALEKALKTPAGERFKNGDCREIIVLFHSVGP